MESLTVVVPFWQGHRTINRLLDSLPSELPVIVVDDCSDVPYQSDRENVAVLLLPDKGFFAGAVNAGVNACQGDVIILNQDVWFEDDRWMDVIAENRAEYALVGESVTGHPAWPEKYVQGTFMYIRRDAWDRVGELNGELYPVWGGTCEWQLRACRAGYRALPLKDIPGMGHEERKGSRFGSAITEALDRWPRRRWEFIKTPPEISVIVPCFNYGKYLDDALNSLFGGPTCLGEWEPQTFQSFEVIIVDDASTDGETREKVLSWHDPWKGIRVVMLDQNVGTPGAINAGIKASHGRFIHVMSADDMMEPWALEKQYAYARRYPHSIIYGDFTTFKSGERIKNLKMREYDFDDLLTKNSMPACVTYHRQAWVDAGGYPATMIKGREDWAFNIAAGVAGYCGYKVPELCGDLVRREGHNRSLHTYRRDFLPQLQMLFPNIYQGERPVGCCGGRAKVMKKTNPPVAAARSLTGREGMRLLRFVGGGDSKRTFWGPVTGQRYKFSGKPPHNIGYVDDQDYAAMLGIYDNRMQQFAPYTPPPFKPPAPKQAEPVEPAEDIVEPPAVIVDATDAAISIAAEHDIDIRQVEGTGKDGKVTAGDVRKLLV